MRELPRSGRARAAREPGAARARRRRGRARRACTARRTTARRSSSPSTRSTRPATRSGTSTGRRTASSTSTTSSASRRRPSCAPTCSSTRSASMGYRGAGVSKLDYARMLAAALAYLLLQQQDQVGHGRVRRASCAATCRRARAAGTSRDLLTALDGARRRRARPISARALAYVSRGGAAALAHRRVLRSARRRDERDACATSCAACARASTTWCVFHLLDRDELTLPFEGTTVFESMEDERQAARRSGRRAQAPTWPSSSASSTAIGAGCAEGDVEYHLVDTVAAAVGGAARVPERRLSQRSGRRAMSFLAPGFVVFAIAVRRCRSRSTSSAAAAPRCAASPPSICCCAASSAWRGAPRCASCCCSLLRALAIAAVPLILAKPFVEARERSAGAPSAARRAR